MTEALGGRRLVVLGGPGSGKSTLTRWLTWAMASGREELSSLASAGELPFRISAAELGERLRTGSYDLDAYVEEKAGRFAAAVRSCASHGRLWLIIDGLDEVTEPALQGRVHDVINHFLADPAYAQVAVLTTSRMVGYHPTGLLAELPRLTLSPLLDEDVEQLLTAWFRQTNADDPDRLVDRMRRRLAQDARMAELASNPLLLTVLALLLARNRELPNERAQLYDAATETLLHSWPVEQRGSGRTLETVRWLAPLARRAFLSPPPHGMPEEEVVEVLAAEWQEQFGGPPGTAREQTRALLHEVRDDSGLLSVTGRNDDGTRLWDFLHRSFAEYLVARALAEDYLYRGADPLEHAHDEAWREVVLMVAGEVGRRRADAVGPIVVGLAELRSTPWEQHLRRDLRLALEVVARDVPCGESAVSTIVDTALETWAQTDVTPLREDLAHHLASLADTRHAALLAYRATAAALT